MKIDILTRCTRLDHILKVKKSIFPFPENVELRWKILFDTSVIATVDSKILSELVSPETIFCFWEGTPGDFGHQLINRAIDEASDDTWIYVLDDDNELHPDFWKRVPQIIEGLPFIHGVIFDQYIGKKDFTGQDFRIAKPENIKVRGIDMAQFVLKKSGLGENRLVPMTYVADGVLMEKIFHEAPHMFAIVNEVLCYYNNLQTPPSKSYSLPRVVMLGGEKAGELKTNQLFEFESSDLNVVLANDEDSVSKIVSHDPDCILSLGESFMNYPSLCRQSYEIRQRWIHPEKSIDLGDMAYQCAMSYILNPQRENLVSIFTPIYNTKEKLFRTYESVKSQTHENWEWVLVNDSTDNVTLKIAEQIAANDPRVKVYDFKQKTRGIIGESKYRACSLSNGNYLLELDHDDYLLPRALELMLRAFEKYPDAGFVYSDCAEITEDYVSLTYPEGFCFGYGSYYEETHMGITFKMADTANINPMTIRHIVGVPNHFRAWKREAYFKAGCHNRRLSIADDYELLVRTFLTTKFVKIPTGCYLQFYHGNNSQDATRADIQRRVRTIATFYNEKIRERFQELGKIDWAYSPGLTWNVQTRKGEEEQFVNYIMNKEDLQ